LILLSIALALVVAAEIISKFLPVFLLLSPVIPVGNEAAVLSAERPIFKFYLTFRVITGCLITGFLIFTLSRIWLPFGVSIFIAAACSILLLVIFSVAVWYSPTRNRIIKRIKKPVPGDRVLFYLAVDMAIFLILMLAAITLVVIAFVLYPNY